MIRITARAYRTDQRGKNTPPIDAASGAAGELSGRDGLGNEKV